jgi:DNA-binding NtrC family response regulator
MVVLARKDRLTAKDVPANIRAAVEKEGDTEGTARIAAHGGPKAAAGAAESLAEAEKNMIFDALDKNNGNRTEAARALGISRRTLHRKLKQYQDSGD